MLPPYEIGCTARDGHIGGAVSGAPGAGGTVNSVPGTGGDDPAAVSAGLQEQLRVHICCN